MLHLRVDPSLRTGSRVLITLCPTHWQKVLPRVKQLRWLRTVSQDKASRFNGLGYERAWTGDLGKAPLVLAAVTLRGIPQRAHRGLTPAHPVEDGLLHWVTCTSQVSLSHGLTISPGFHGRKSYD